MEIEKPKLERPDKGESREAAPGCGRTRSSDETAVMAAERRGPVIYTSEVKQPGMGGFDERKKIV
jgi:hypothetical protein